MRWIWIDKFTEFTPRERAVAIKQVTAAEEHVHDRFPDFAHHPASLIIEGMAQTGGLLVGHANDYREKVILAKIGRATFHRLARPGHTIYLTADIETLNDTGASVKGTATVDDGKGTHPLADIDLMFSHIDQNLGGQTFPEHNFVFEAGNFRELLAGPGSDIDLNV